MGKSVRGFTFIVFTVSGLAIAESNYSCVLDAGGHERKISVSLREEVLQMTVNLDQGQTIRASVTETTDHASGNRFYFCDTGGFTYKYEIGLTVLRDTKQARLTLKQGAHSFQCQLAYHSLP